MVGLLFIVCVYAVLGIPSSTGHPSYSNRSITSSSFLCQPRLYSYVIRCTDQGVLLKYGYCATFDEEREGVFITKCPYYQLEGHNVSTELAGYIVLPDNISELNNYMCGPMNRKGFVCKDCIDGFGPSATALGYRCSNCTDVWYGIPLYLALEFVPMTLFYLIILLFKVHLTSAPMTLYIIYSQMFIYEILFGRMEPVERIMSQVENNPLLSVVLTFHGIWNLDFIRYVTPPFCISTGFRPTYIELLDYFSIFYLLFLILLTWLCIELHGRNFRLLVWAWKPFHKCFARLHREWDTRNDILDVFASLFFLFYVKSSYLGIVLRRCFPLKYTIKGIDYNSCVNIDGHFLRDTATTFIVIMLFALNVLPFLLFVLYPFKLFRRCLSKCRMDKVCVTMFVEKFQGNYKDGLQGGRDMRIFSGMKFLMVVLISSYHSITVKTRLNVSYWLYTALILLAFALLIAFLQPYKKTYMNILDTLILTHCIAVCLLLSRNYFDGDEIQLFVLMLLLPLLLFTSLIVLKIGTGLKTRVMKCWRHRCRKPTNQNERKELLGQRKLDSYPTTTIVDIGLYGACST